MKNTNRDQVCIETSGGSFVGGDINTSGGNIIGRDQININLFISVSERVIREIVNKTGWGRNHYLYELQRASKARCISRWLATGVSAEDAERLFEDKKIGYHGDEIKLDGSKPVQILVGDFGSGKSLIIERLFQSAIIQAISNKNAPLPVYLEAQQIQGALVDAIEKATYRLGNPGNVGAIVFIDGADEAGISKATKLRDEARKISRTWPHTTVIITSRPIPGLDHKSEIIEVRLLSEDEIKYLINQISGGKVRWAWAWPKSIRDAIRRPLFAILLGLYMIENWESKSYTLGHLLSSLVERAIPRTSTNSENAYELLQKLARISTDHGGGYIQIAEIGQRNEVHSLVTSRLVVERSRSIGFPLPILSQWFAAQSLSKGSPSIEDLISDPERLEHWRYPLIILASSFDFETTSRVLKPITKVNPGLAGIIVHEAIPETSDEAISPLSAIENGRRIRIAMQAWVDGLYSLVPLIFPANANGQVPPIGVRNGNFGMAFSWYEGSDITGDVVPVLDDFGTKGHQRRSVWKTITYTRIGDHPAWAWRLTLNALRDRLSTLIDERVFRIQDGFLHKELMWKIALKIMNLGDLYTNTINIDDLETRISELPMQSQKEYHNLIHEFVDYLSKIKNEGGNALLRPLPGPDIEITQSSCWVWEPYSPNRTLERTKVVFAAALAEYPQIVRTCFPGFANRFRTYVTLPARIKGIVKTEQNHDGFSGMPTIKWYFDPLSKGEQSSVDIVLGNFDESDSPDFNKLSQLYDKLCFLRPEASEWISARLSSSVLHIFNVDPVSQLVYEWLKADLKDIHWLN